MIVRIVLGASVFAMCLMIPSTATAAEGVVSKLAEGFEAGGWRAGASSTAAGVVRVVDEPAPGVDSTKSLLIEPSFAGAFGGFGAEATRPLYIPGQCKTVTIRFKISDKRYGLRVGFIDGWGRDAVDGKALNWEVKTDGSTDWQSATFTVPADWVPPIAIAGFGTHNWNAQAERNKVQILIDDVRVQTDLTNVDPATGLLSTWKPEPNPAKPDKALKAAPATPLIHVELSTAAEANVFAGAEPAASVKVQNWQPQPLTGKVSFEVVSDEGKAILSTTKDVTVDAIEAIDLPLDVPRFGVYTLKASLTAADGVERTRSLHFAKLPERRQLTEAQKDASPYGINYHGGGRLILKPFRDAGIIWFRDYAFGYGPITSARGADGTYGGWPFFPRIVKSYADADTRLIACLQKSVTAPAVEGGKVVGPLGPSTQWTRDIADFMLRFPEIHHWEMSNEYDLPAANAEAERLVNWENYNLYHARLGELVQLFGGGQWTAIENGRAGIWPDLVADCVRSGKFDQIGVINSHHYTGTETPEENFTNFNTSTDAWGGKAPGLFFDELRETSRIAQSDGKPREHWLSEFGWDTLAGPIVSPFEQAVFLQRGWMLTMAAGCSKAMWFYNFDSAEPKQFFDGCGLMTHDAQPKLSLAAMAGLAWVLPSPRFVGTVNAGPNTGGYVFEQDGKYVASLFAIRGDGPSVEVKAEKVYDYLANPIAAGSVKLSGAPTYAVGIDRAGPLYKQTAYSIDTRNMELASAGDTVTTTVLVDNNRDTAIDATLQVVVPDGWTAQATSFPINVPAGEKKRIEVPFTVGSADLDGLRTVAFTAVEGGQPVKQFDLKVMLRPSVVFTVAPIEGKPGDTELTFNIGNKSRKPVSGTLSLALPGNWKAANDQIEVKDIKPGELRQVKTQLTWATGWKTGESAIARFKPVDGIELARPIIPNQLSIPQAGTISIDGDLGDWSESTRVPNWLLGSSSGQPDADVHLAWSADGLYGAVTVRNSKLLVTDPRSFWAGDVLELFIDTADDKQPRAYKPGDHQFWFVPQPKDNRVYVGRWKAGDEIPATRYALPNVKSAARQTADGYVMEFLLPAEHLQNFKLSAQSTIGLNINLTVQSQTRPREVFWPRLKEPDARLKPATWGSVTLAPGQ